GVAAGERVVGQLRPCFAELRMFGGDLGRRGARVERSFGGRIAGQCGRLRLEEVAHGVMVPGQRTRLSIALPPATTSRNTMTTATTRFDIITIHDGRPLGGGTNGLM